MDMFIDRWDSTLLSDAEIDLICDGIEDIFFKEFFDSCGTQLGIWCVDFDGEMDRVIFCDNEVDIEWRNLIQEQSLSVFDEFYAAECENAEPNFEAQTLRVNGTDVTAEVFDLKFSSTMIHIYTSYTGSVEEYCARASVYGLAVMLCHILAKRDPSAEKLEEKIRETKMRHIDDAVRKNADHCLRQLLSSSRSSAVNWRNEKP